MKRFHFILTALLLSVASQAQPKRTIHFASDQFILSSEAHRQLDSLITYLQRQTGYRVELVGHCDNTGNPEHNQVLSLQRANAVADYLTAKGIAVEKKQGAGYMQPIASNDNEQGKQKNRRVDITYQVAIAQPATASPPSEKATEPAKKQEVSTSLDPNTMEVGSVIRLKNMNFEGGTAVFLEESLPTLKELLQIMQENPTLEIEVEGFVCCADDMPLSLERAVAVCKFLDKNGIDKKRLSYQGHSNYFPIASDATENGRKQNRRVEIKVIKK